MTSQWHGTCDLRLFKKSSPNEIDSFKTIHQAKCTAPLKLLKAAYHLGNRHVEIELHDKELFLLNDVVMKKLLERQGFAIESFKRPFSPEIGAYE